MIEEIISKIRKWGPAVEAKPESKPVEKASDEKPVLNRAVLEHLREISPENSGEFLREVVNMFLQQAPVIVNEIYQHCKDKRYQEMGHAAHKLKGSSVNLGAVALGDICREIEISGRDNKTLNCDELLVKLKSVFDQTALELRKSI